MKKIFNIKQIASTVLALSFPMLAAAATIEGLLGQVKTILNLVIGLLFVVVTLYFVWGVVQYVSAAGSEDKLKTGKQHMIWGVIGMAVMAGAWGIVRIILQSFDVSTGTGGITPPTGF
jgi:TRAP-type C4-dicarboxylate transport system permease small subunit